MRSGDAAPWRLVRDDITRGITSGRWPVGTAIPSYAQLAADHHVSVHTVRRAIRDLRDAGILRGEQGVSVFVERDPATSVSVEERVAALEADAGPSRAELAAEVAQLRERLDAHLRRHQGDSAS